MSKILEKGRSWHGEICNKKKNGRIFLEWVSILPVRNEMNEITHYVALKSNITAQKDMERLEEDVDSILRHDLKPPLNVIIGFSNFLKLYGNLDEEQIGIIKRIEEAGNSILHIIDLSLDMFKMETGKYEYNAQKVDVLAVVSQIIEYNCNKLLAKNLECRLSVNGNKQLQDETFMVWSEERLLYLLLSNLFTNAIEVSPDANKILIEIVESGSICIAIHNKGVVPKAIRNYFFGKYKTLGKAQGTGLGIYSAKLLANTMHYDMHMETSDKNDVTCVAVYIPKEQY
jgi:signal transduction histidine kinase